MSFCSVCNKRLPRSASEQAKVFVQGSQKENTIGGIFRIMQDGGVIREYNHCDTPQCYIALLEQLIKEAKEKIKDESARSNHPKQDKSKMRIKVPSWDKHPPGFDPDDTREYRFK